MFWIAWQSEFDSNLNLNLLLHQSFLLIYLE